MSVPGKTVGVALLSLAVTLAKIASGSRVPGLEVPFEWWIIGAILPVAISAPVTFLMARQSEDIRTLNA
jgi:hypothetical protein